MIEEHPFAKGYRFYESEILVLGSFPCKVDNSYGNWYYSGSKRNYFWRIMGIIYDTEIDSYEEKICFCLNQKIAFADIGLKVSRGSKGCLDKDLEILQFNTIEIIEILQNNPIAKIFYTSKFVRNLFQKIKTDNLILENLVKNLYEKVLFSPSPSANRSIGRLEDYKKLKKKNFNTIDFRVMMYEAEFKG